MPTRERRYSLEEFARRGQEIYDRAVKPTLQPGDMGKFVAIDIESGSYEINKDGLVAGDRLYERHPDAQIWLMRAGEPATYRMGWRPPREGAG